ncbi:GNAT family N-acetyltransferase [Labrenzia sp. R5_0]|uniref:GNAT family N-acetyltransferase n=1 Tax=Labrenzia sp. R5_0 TaxID=2821108 RepID=UPI001AD9CFE1|nr:GNAT family N-acetyltransferase [Labrenzia sp. R5_0]MBO9458973.1 GNAT family N-acetyltransferase [Labrenzia sp. R5_0]
MASTFEYHPQPTLITWAETKMRETYPGFVFARDARAIGHARDGELVAVVVYDRWSENDCMVHVVSDGSRSWMTRSFAVVAMAYPFRQLGFTRITAMVSELNEESLRFSQRFGWRLEGYLRKAGPKGEGLLLFGMLKSECRWLPEAAETFRSDEISGIEGWQRAQDVLSRSRRTSNGQVSAIRAGSGSEYRPRRTQAG